VNWNDLRLRLRAIFSPAKAEQDLTDELAFHVEMQTRKNVALGIPEADALRTARAQFGHATSTRELCRDERRIGFLETLFQDIRYAVRSFRRAPTFSLTVIATIGLGLGVNAAVFTLFNAYVLRPLAVREPYSLYLFQYRDRAGKFHDLTSRQFDQLQAAESPAIEDLHAVIGLAVRINGRQCFSEFVSPNYFRMLGVSATIGRTLVPGDNNNPSVMVLGSSTWHNQFGGDPAIIGKKILVRGYPVEVVGVAQDGFGGLGDFPRDFWMPLALAPQVLPKLDSISVIIRLKRGLGEAQAKALLVGSLAQLTLDAPASERAVSVTLESRATSVHLGFEGMLMVMPMFVAFGLILLIACANVANMMLARAMARQREMSTRLSLGAARSRLIRQLLTESIVLALPGAAVGFLLSRLVIDTAVRLILHSLPGEFVEFFHFAPLDPDARVFTFMLVAAVASGILFGFAPAIQATRPDFGKAFRPQRLRNALVIVQVATCSLLLIAAGVLLRASNSVHDLDTGLRTRDVVWVELLEPSRARVLATLAQQGSIDTLAATSHVPFDAGFPSARLSSGRQALDFVSYDYVSPEVFEVFDIRMRQGRVFTAVEAHSDLPVAIVSETVAKRMWPNEDAVGKSFQAEVESKSNLSRGTPLRYSEVRVIGVSADINVGLTDDRVSHSMVYFPATARTAQTKLLLRVKGDTESARQSIDRALSAAAPGAVDKIHKMQEQIAGRVYPFRMTSWISTFLGLLALLLTITGIYGVISYLVQQRTKEMGIRKALGATSSSVVALVLRQSARLALMGITIGAALSLAVSRLLSSVLVVVSGFDMLALTAGIAVVLAACLAASLYPSLEAAGVDPMTTLRHD